MFGTVLVSDLVPGAALRYRSTSGKHTFVAGEVLEVEAPRRLVHTFTFPNLPDAPSLVTWSAAVWVPRAASSPTACGIQPHGARATLGA